MRQDVLTMAEMRNCVDLVLQYTEPIDFPLSKEQQKMRYMLFDFKDILRRLNFVVEPDIQ